MELSAANDACIFGDIGIIGSGFDGISLTASALGFVGVFPKVEGG